MAQAVVIGRQEPCALNLIAMLPPAMFAISIGMKYAETRFGPFSLSIVIWFEKVWMPPIPEPKYTPKRSGSILPRISLSFTACVAAAIANCANRSFLRSSPLSI